MPQLPLLDSLIADASDEWATVLRPFEGETEAGIHLAVFVEPYLSFILQGTKTVESRFSRNYIAPHGRVAVGDLILLKASGKPVVGHCRVSQVWDYVLDPASWEDVRSFGAALQAQDGFWESRRNARFATLIRVSDVRRCRPLVVDKRDRRGWVVLRGSGEQERLL